MTQGTDFMMSTGLSGVQFGLKVLISKSRKPAARVRFEITSMISDQNCTPLILLPLYCTIFILNGNVRQSFRNNSCKIRFTMVFFAFSFCLNFIGYFKQTLKPDLLFCFSFPFSLAGEKMRLRFEICCYVMCHVQVLTLRGLSDDQTWARSLLQSKHGWISRNLKALAVLTERSQIHPAAEQRQAFVKVLLKVMTRLFPSPAMGQTFIRWS